MGEGVRPPTPCEAGRPRQDTILHPHTLYAVVPRDVAVPSFPFGVRPDVILSRSLLQTVRCGPASGYLRRVTERRILRRSVLGMAALGALAACSRREEHSGEDPTTVETPPSDGGGDEGGEGPMADPVAMLIDSAGYDAMVIALVGDGALRSWDITLLSGGSEVLRYRLQGAWDGESPQVDGYQRLEEVRALAGAPSLQGEIIMPRSNWEFAFQIDVDGDKQFVPYHGTPTAFAADPAVVSVDGQVLDLAAVEIGMATPATSFSLEQTVVARHPARPGEDLARISTTITVEANGRLSLTGSWTALGDLVMGAAYGPMLPFSRDVFDQVGTDVTESLEVDSVAESRRDGEPVEQTIPVEGASAALIRSTEHGWSAAIRWVDARRTLRSDDNQDGNSDVFLQLRDDGIAKVYPQVWDQGQDVPGGTTWEFGAEWAITPTA